MVDIFKLYKCNSTFILLDNNNVLLFYLSLAIKDGICFIDKFDSTAYSKKCKSRDFIIYILRRYLQDACLIYCFCKTSNFYIFDNKEKNVLDNYNLREYWKSVYKMFDDKGEIYYLNSRTENVLNKIFNDITDIPLFSDDPITKALTNREIRSMKKLYEVLCCRNDFNIGTYVYCKRKVKGISNVYTEDNTMADEISEYLKSLCFTGETNIIKSSQMFIEKYNPEMEEITINRNDWPKRQQNKGDEKPAIVLKGKRRK